MGMNFEDYSVNSVGTFQHSKVSEPTLLPTEIRAQAYSFSKAELSWVLQWPSQ